ncbi:MAG: hypothetical protein FJZ63_01240 [Chlamydiae bacterium]|nr:hypothetical protein [Chlamydiota bacterium]
MVTQIKPSPANEISDPAVRRLAQSFAMDGILHNPPQLLSSRGWNYVLQEVTQKFPTIFPKEEHTSEYLQPIFHQVSQKMISSKDKTADTPFVKYTMQELILEKTLAIATRLNLPSRKDTLNFVRNHLKTNYSQIFPPENRSSKYLTLLLQDIAARHAPRPH